MSYYLTRGQTHLIAPGDIAKTVCGQSLEYVNKATNDKAGVTCKRCKGEIKPKTKKK